jgi:hypothetical protein
LPNWEDRIDPHYSLEDDVYSTTHNRDPHENDVYAHEIYVRNPPYDGILVSLSNYNSKIKPKEDGNGSFLIRNAMNLRDYFRIPPDSGIELMGDCGAYSYVSLKSPPEPFYTVENVANIYDKLGFDFGVSVDHMAVNSYRVKDMNGKKKTVRLSEKEKIARVNLTLHNAEQFFEVTRERKYHYTPIGVIQGFNKKSYRESARKTVEMGYEYVAVGGLVQYTSQEIINILSELHPVLSEVKVHLFGVLRQQYLKQFGDLGVTSFDSASYLRKAWLRSGQNYLGADGKWYAAIRVPFAKDKRIQKKAEEMGISQLELESLEKRALDALREYSNGRSNIESTLERVMDYDKLLVRNSNDGENLRSRYEKTLLKRPWEMCDCEICQHLGIEVVIFRGTNRNKQRGFHNNWVFRNSMNTAVRNNTSSQISLPRVPGQMIPYALQRTSFI